MMLVNSSMLSKVKNAVRNVSILTESQINEKKAKKNLTRRNKHTQPTIIHLAKKVVRNHEIEKLRAFKEQKT